MVNLLPFNEVRYNNPNLQMPLSPPLDELKRYDTIYEERLPSNEEDVVISSPPSLESLLAGFSKAPYSRVAFMSYLKTRHCSENLEFLIDSNQYVSSRRNNIDENHNQYESIHNERLSLWKHIFSQFISHDSPKEVNIPSELKHKLVFHFKSNSLPEVELIEQTMNSIKELLRDTYFQFIQQVKRASPSYDHHQCNHPAFCATYRKSMYVEEKVYHDFNLMPTPTDESIAPTYRRSIEHCSPLDKPNSLFEEEHSRAGSPLSDSRNSRSNSSYSNCGTVSSENVNVAIPRSVENNSYETTDDVTKKGSKNSFSEASTGLKKFAGKLRWRRLSSNSSTSSS